LEPTIPTRVFTHHHLKVLPKEVVQLDEEYIHLPKVYEPFQIWREVINPKVIKKPILERNNWHI